MDYVKLSSRALQDGRTEVTVSIDGDRFTGTIPTAMIGTENEHLMLTAMAGRVASQQAKLREITAPGQQVYD